MRKANNALRAASSETVVRVQERTAELAAANAALRAEIDERRRIVEPVRQSEARYRSLVENTAFGIFFSTLDGRFLEVNPALVAILGYESRDDLLTVHIGPEVYQNPADEEQLSARLLRQGRVAGAEVAWKRKHGESITVRLSGRLVLDEQQKPFVEGIVEDMTERAALEKQVRGLQKFEAIGQLAGGIAHDFNNVLGAMMGWADLAMNDVAPGSPAQQKLERIRSQTQKAAGLTRQLLAFARRQILEPRNLNLNDAVADALNLLEKIIGSHIEIKTVLAPGVSAVRADPTQIEQVLVNLVVNARDAMAHGGRLLIETVNANLDEEFFRIHRWAHPRPYVRLSVSDTGEGMSAETLEHIFEPFFTTKELGRGTGLGLATVYGIVKQHDGFVHVYSELGQGATFRVYLPASAGAAEKVKKTESQAIVGGTETILLAEDHEGLREIAVTVLEQHGYTVLAASNGQEAVETFKRHPEGIALVVMDVTMPKLTGPDAFREMAALKPDAAVLFTTGHSVELDPIKSAAGDAAVVLQKPYSSEALVRKVRDVLDRGKA